jgi:Cupin
MIDPLSEVIALLRPRTVLTKGISGAGRWGVRYTDFGQPSFCTVIEGRCRLAVDGQNAITLEAGDFVLMPATPGFTMSGFEPVTPERIDPKKLPSPTGNVRHGRRGGRPDARLLGGYFVFESPDAGLLVSLLPTLVHVRGVERLSMLVRFVGEESSERRSGRDLILSRLVDVLLIEALRSTQGEDASPGLLRGLSDARRRYGRCTATLRARGPWPNSRRKPRCLVLRSSIASHAPWGFRRWSTSSLGAWPSRRTCSAATNSALPQSPNASVIARRAPSAPHSAVTSASRQVATREQR